jgi:ketosteroid isomerase-like protein
VLAHVRVSGTGREGIKAELKFGQVWTFQGGRAVRVDNYTDWDDARRAAGLRE